MGTDKNDLNLAKSFLERAREDLKSAEILLNAKQYSDSTFHSQQAAEKVAKALLVLENMFVKEHIVSHILSELNIEEKIVESVKDLEEHWIKPRYPLIGRGIVWNPSKMYNRKIAEDALKKAKFVVEEISKILKQRGVEV